MSFVPLKFRICVWSNLLFHLCNRFGKSWMAVSKAVPWNHCVYFILSSPSQCLRMPGLESHSCHHVGRLYAKRRCCREALTCLTLSPFCSENFSIIAFKVDISVYSRIQCSSFSRSVSLTIDGEGDKVRVCTFKVMLASSSLRSKTLCQKISF